MKDLIREIERTTIPVLGDRDVNGTAKCLGKYDVIDLIINYEIFKEWKKNNLNIFYDNNYYYMPDNIKVINQDWFEVKLVQKEWRENEEKERRD